MVKMVSSPRFGRGRFVLAAGAAALLSGVAFAQVPIGQLSPDGVSVRGKVAEDFGGKFVLSDETGRILVEPRGGLPPDVKITTGETLTATGIPRLRTFDAVKIARENGEIAFAAPPAPPQPVPPPGLMVGAPLPPPPPLGAPPPPLPGGPGAEPASVGAGQIAETLRANGLTAIGAPDRKKRHIEIPARDASGRDVVVSLDLAGRMWEVEDAEETDDKWVTPRITSTAQAIEVVRQAGFAPTGQVERRKHHFEVLARDGAGERVEVHLDLSGHIYKRAWVR